MYRQDAVTRRNRTQPCSKVSALGSDLSPRTPAWYHRLTYCSACLRTYSLQRYAESSRGSTWGHMTPSISRYHVKQPATRVYAQGVEVVNQYWNATRPNLFSVGFSYSLICRMHQSTRDIKQCTISECIIRTQQTRSFPSTVGLLILL